MTPIASDLAAAISRNCDLHLTGQIDLYTWDKNATQLWALASINGCKQEVLRLVAPTPALVYPPIWHTSAKQLGEKMMAAGRYPFVCPACQKIFRTATEYFPHCSAACSPKVVCPDCFGSGEIMREDGSDQIVRAVCLECSGRGYYQEVV